VEFSGRPFNTLVLLFVASTLLAVGLGTTGALLRRTAGNRRLLLAALAVNLGVIPLLGWGLAELLAPSRATFIALVLAGASPGGPFGAKLVQIQRGDVVAGAATMAILAVLGSVCVPVIVALILSTARVGGADDIAIEVAPLIARIVASQVVPFFVGMTIRAMSPRIAARLHPWALLFSTVSFLTLLGWIVIEGYEDVVRLPVAFLVASIALTALAVTAGWLIAPGPPTLRTSAGAVAGVRNAAPMLAVIGAAFAGEEGIFAAVAAIVLVELLLQLPWNLRLAWRRTAPDPTGVTVTVRRPGWLRSRWGSGR
jgi:BASS family bile acid:Na+ symporter